MKPWIAGVTAALSVSLPAAAEVVAVSDAGFVVRVSAEVTASAQDGWKELVTPANWWNKAHTFSGDPSNLYLDSQATGCFCEKLPVASGAEGQRPGSVAHMQIVYVDPGKALRMSGALGPLQSEALHGTLTITLKPVSGRTRILWEYVVGGYMRYKPEDIATAVDKVLAEQLGSLASKLGAVTPPAAKAVPPGGKARAKEGPAKTAAKRADNADDPDDQKLDEPVDQKLPPDAPDESDAEAPAPIKPGGAGKRQPKPDGEYVEPTR